MHALVAVPKSSQLAPPRSSMSHQCPLNKSHHEACCEPSGMGDCITQPWSLVGLVCAHRGSLQPRVLQSQRLCPALQFASGIIKKSAFNQSFRTSRKGTGDLVYHWQLVVGKRYRWILLSSKREAKILCTGYLYSTHRSRQALARWSHSGPYPCSPAGAC